MEIKDYDLESLTTLWLASNSDQELKTEIEKEIQNRILSNKKYSIENVYEASKVRNGVINVYFIPTTDAYKNYGQYLTIDLKFEVGEESELLKNITSKPKIETFGTVKALLLFKDQLAQDQTEILKNLEFQTNEILRVE